MNILPSYKQRMRLDLYEQGLTDSEIARVMHVSTRAICYWRESLNLKPNGRAGRKKVGKTIEQKEPWDSQMMVFRL